MRHQILRLLLSYSIPPKRYNEPSKNILLVYLSCEIILRLFSGLLRVLWAQVEADQTMSVSWTLEVPSLIMSPT